jgi:hypothetical protein
MDLSSIWNTKNTHLPHSSSFHCRLGKKVRVKWNEDDTIGDLKKLAAAQLGTRPEKLKIQKWFVIEWSGRG